MKTSLFRRLFGLKKGSGIVTYNSDFPLQPATVFIYDPEIRTNRIEIVRPERFLMVINVKGKKGTIYVDKYTHLMKSLGEEIIIEYRSAGRKAKGVIIIERVVQ